MSLIDVKNLTKIYVNEDIETPALSGVTFQIEKGEFVAIMGPSGSGKSTLLHILGFLDHPTGGSYKLEDKTISDYSDDEAAQIRNQKMGFVFQAFNLMPRTSVLENVQLPLLYSQKPENTWEGFARLAIEAVGLLPRINYHSSQLSGGEKQRVAIARAIVNNPKIIFADEPTGNLDSKSGGQIMEILEKLHADGHTIILITHETYTAEYAERIIRLKDGKIESDDRVKDRRYAGDHFVK